MDLLVSNPGLQFVAFKIFENLDIESFENCRLVNKKWRNVIDANTDLNFKVYAEEIYKISDDYGTFFDIWPQWLQIFEDFIWRRNLNDLKTFTYFIKDYVYECKFKLEDPFHYATKSGNFEILELLMDSMSDLNVKSKKHDGSTPFVIAAKFGHTQIVQYFIEVSKSKNIDLNAVDDFGQSAYIWALMKGRKNVLKIIRNHGQIRQF